MTRSKRWVGVVAGIALAGTAALVVPALAEPGGPGHGGPGCGGGRGGFASARLERRVERLDLDAKTKASVYTILDQARVEERTRRADMHAAHERMRALLEQPDPDAKAVEAEADAIGALMTAAKKADLRTLLAVRAQLPSELRGQLQLEMKRSPKPAFPS